MSVQTIGRPEGEAILRPDYPIYDADHHYYEPADAFLRHLPKEYKPYFQYATINGRTKLVVDGHVTGYIPNPTFDVVAAPGSHVPFYRADNPEGKSLREMAEVIPGDASFHNGAAHLKVMDEQGLHAAVVYPTLASVVEGHLGHKPAVVRALFRSLNRWVADEYGFTNGRQFPVAAISLTDVDEAVAELEFVLKAGARVLLIRPAPVITEDGGLPIGHKSFDPFWARVNEAKVLVAHHTSDSGYDMMYKYWTGGETKGTAEWRPFERTAFKWALQGMGRAAMDATASTICLGLFDRFKNLRISHVESGSEWVGPMLNHLKRNAAQFPKEYGRCPVETFREHFSVMPFYEDSCSDLAKLIGIENVLFGSDWPHPEGLAKPLEFFADIQDLSPEHQKLVMSTNQKKLLEGDW